MRILVTGGAGFLGTLLTQRLLQADDSGDLDVTEVICLDLAPSPIEDPRVRSIVGGVDDPAAIHEALTDGADAIVHLAAVLSGGSEEDMDLAMRVNVDGTRLLLEACRARRADDESATAPVFVLTSSLAVFGGDVPDVVPPTWATQPDSTYGATKAIAELLVNEYSRRGFIDGRICRLPTISVRPGRPNSAASSFASGIIREPLRGERSNVPVPLDTRMWLSSPRTAVENLLIALQVPGEKLGRWRAIDVPGITVTVAEMLDSLERVGGAAARALVTEEADERIASIVTSWPGAFESERLLELGFVRDDSFDAIIEQFVADES